MPRTVRRENQKGWRLSPLRPASRSSNSAGSEAMSGRPVPPRSATSSMSSAAWRTPVRSRPSASSGCLSSDNRPTGSPGRNTACSVSRSRLAAGVLASGVPPESSATMPKRSSSAETRRASSRSPVTRAACCPAARRPAFSAMAIATASSRSLAASTSVTSAKAAAMSPASKRDARLGPQCRWSPPAAAPRRQARARKRQRGLGCHRPPRLRRAARRSCRSVSPGRIADGRARAGSGAGSLQSRQRTPRPASVSRPGSTTAPLRQAGDRGKQFRRGGDRAGRAGGDHRAGRRIAFAAASPRAGSARCGARPDWTGRAPPGISARRR